MGDKLAQIPTNLITGFLGSGKTTAILHLLKSKPANSKWAVLVNEFGEVGIDGAMLAEHDWATGSFIKEVPGGCICCAAGLPLQMALNLLIKQADPERLLIEPTGVGHPKKVLQILTGQFYKEVLDVRASICLVDPHKLSDQRVNSMPSFVDQMNISDVLLANKSDQASIDELKHFNEFAQSFSLPKAAIEIIKFGQFSADLLDLKRNTERSVNFPEAHPVKSSEAAHQSHEHEHEPAADALSVESTPESNRGCDWQRFENKGSDYYSCGWIFNSEILFDESQLEDWFNSEGLSRIKGIFNTNNGWRVLNRVDEQMSNKPTDYNIDSRVEIIEATAQDWKQIEVALLECIETF